MQARKFDYQTMTQLDRQLAADAAHLGLYQMQDLSPEEIALGVSVLFAAVMRRVGLDPAEQYAMGLRVLRSEPLHRRANDSLQSLQDFAGVRIKGDENVSIG